MTTIRLKPQRPLACSQAVNQGVRAVPWCAVDRPTDYRLVVQKFSGQELRFWVCHKCAVRFEPMCADVSFFNTLQKCFRAGYFCGKSLISGA